MDQPQYAATDTSANFRERLTTLDRKLTLN